MDKLAGSSGDDKTPFRSRKRARSALDGGGCSLPGGGLNHRGTIRDWANLGDGPAGHIADLALANDVADYVRFRAVCRPWRRCSPDPRAAGLDARFLPRHWIMLENAFAGPRRRFFNVRTGECIRTDLPLLAYRRHLFALPTECLGMDLPLLPLLTLTTEGLLLLLHEPTHTLRLLNPLTLQLTRLPPVTALLRPDQQEAMARGSELRDMIRVCAASIIVAAGGAPIVAVTFYNPMALAVAKPGDETWAAIDHRDRLDITNSLPFRGRLYCASRLGVMVLDNISSGQPRLVMAAEWIKKPFYLCPMSASLHLVDNGGELMLVHRELLPMDYTDEDEDEDDDDDDDEEEEEEHHNHDEDDDRQTYSRNYQVYRVDLDAGILIPAVKINGRAVFMGMTRTISVSPEAFPFLTADTIYLGSDCDSEISGYNLVDGSREPCNYGSCYPSSMVECLCCCIKGTGKLLA
ncbi:uncharacterized protein LOC100827569 [Brachypodium distachyon]|uniref:KIB1-4 beta-propeller domain-containing protein n=1 Tax=Brachypodium distachyon TaxID=15368 RepID=A0A0Q3GC30_BRADI|nr:uncharacterized protein LOC100827569 [Brachypodium distachyon]KQK08077.2 hypothetical protein BRADI_2g39616v3 [Brachypodium distachyon]|eukprot:XP_024314851.1 uncharacterized protein LOC100827569 [Brachypodium distachyon]